MKVQDFNIDLGYYSTNKIYLNFGIIEGELWTCAFYTNTNTYFRSGQIKFK